MKKTLAIAILVSLFGINTAMADILPEGKKNIPVCAYFNNTADFSDTLAVYGYETGPDGERTDLTQYIADECFHTSYKFNDFGIYAVTSEHNATIDLSTFDPREDEEAYPTDRNPEIGNMLVDEDSTLESVANEYTILELDLEAKLLKIDPVKTTKYFDDGSDAEVTEGEITYISEDTEEEDPVENPEEEDVVVLFTDVDSSSTYYDALKYLKDQGTISGYPDGSYKPNSTINRAEFTKIIVGSISTEDELTNCYSKYSEEGSDKVSLFSDVEFTTGGERPWYFDYVCVAKEKQIIGGYPDGSFLPAQDINFVEAAKIIVEGIDYDTTESEPWYKRYVMEFSTRNAIPTTITTFNQQVTRGEMAEMMYRLRTGKTDLPSMDYEELQ